MRVLFIHDRYYESTQCGELNVLRRERAALQARGVETDLLEWPQRTETASMLRKGFVQARSVYSLAARRRTHAALADFTPDVVHVHNFWPQATPAVHHACKRAGVPVVQTLHNYRILCAADIMLRDGQPCELCVETRLAWPAVSHRCVQGKTSRSAFKAMAFSVHRIADTWNRCVDIFLAPTESMRRQFIRGGIDANRIVVRPQAAPDLGAGSEDRGYFLFAGRLAYEKGLLMLLDLWERGVGAELRIAGGGPLESRVRESAARCPRIRYLGALSPDAVGEVMRHAVATIVPSLWEEPFPLVIAESYAAGTPVVAADAGSRSETVLHGQTGLVFAAGDDAGLAAAVRRTIDNPEESRLLGRAARQRYEATYSEAAACTQLLEIYENVRSRGGKAAIGTAA